MEGVEIFDGDKILVDRSIDPRVAHVVLAVLDDTFTVKELRYRNGQPSYTRPIPISR